MTDLHPICALGATQPQTRRFGPLTLAENSELALASVALRRDAASPDLPQPVPGEWQAAGDIAAFWTGPDQWMVEGPGLAATDFAAQIAARAPGCSVTEQTDGFVAFEITSTTGPGPIRALLEKLVNVDAHRFTAGHATRTGFHHMSVFVIRRADDRLALIGMRSAAGTIWHALTDAAEQLEVMA
ncbi:sarcosine oxidase subunit gamma [Paracoccus laeviglucosivorans]|uniref:Sarcosine oxidase subunit gamma n=1 Tax=Paracoccus laeviglucosivorans TaxID=1197861 RepID=A0A521F8G6_9RHOB|nr:sarcosine oxidase subunit gamma [Paracoccus laeviglucosivorans]SMO92502.1 sarcosine oxidase subunit gamma [Paracoccus laeviglucosivorans]